MAGNTALTATASAEEEPAPAPADQQQAEPQQANALTVTQLPDIKLNNNLITKTVFDYPSYAELAPAEQFLLSGDTENALKFYTDFAGKQGAEDKIKAQAALNAAVIFLQRRDYKQALKYADTALKNEPFSPFAQLFKVWVYSAQGKVKETEKASKDLLFLTADFEYLASSKLAVAQAYFNAGKKNKAMDILQNLYGTHPYIKGF